jgi:hypothetical protein
VQDEIVDSDATRLGPHFISFASGAKLGSLR